MLLVWGNYRFRNWIDFWPFWDKKCMLKCDTEVSWEVTAGLSNRIRKPDIKLATTLWELEADRTDLSLCEVDCFSISVVECLGSVFFRNSQKFQSFIHNIRQTSVYFSVLFSHSSHKMLEGFYNLPIVNAPHYEQLRANITSHIPYRFSRHSGYWRTQHIRIITKIKDFCFHSWWHISQSSFVE